MGWRRSRWARTPRTSRRWSASWPSGFEDRGSTCSAVTATRPTWSACWRRGGRSVPVIAMSHGWTAETWKVRVYETLDRACLRRMDRVVCVSEGQAEKVRRAGVRADRVAVIRNAVRAERFDHADPADRRVLEAMFPQAPERIVGSAGRLSPEKGFGVLVEAAAIVARSDPGAGFIHFGDGPLRETIQRRIAELGLERRFILAGFRDDLDRFLPHWDLSVLPSFTEGLPTVVLESYAAGVPVVATAVGGTPEAVADGVDGYLVPPGDPAPWRGASSISWKTRTSVARWAGWVASGSAPSSPSTPKRCGSNGSARSSPTRVSSDCRPIRLAISNRRQCRDPARSCLLTLRGVRVLHARAVLTGGDRRGARHPGSCELMGEKKKNGTPIALILLLCLAVRLA